MAMPTVHMAAHCVVDGEESSDIMESDIVTCAARVMLTRHSHLTPGMLPIVHPFHADGPILDGKMPTTGFTYGVRFTICRDINR